MSKFVREGLGTIGRGSSIFCITDFFSVLGYYRALKREEDNLPLLIRKEDFGEIDEDMELILGRPSLDVSSTRAPEIEHGNQLSEKQIVFQCELD